MAIDWDFIPDTSALETERRKNTNNPTFREVMDKAYEKEAALVQKSIDIKMLDKLLLKALVSRTPILVKSHISNLTDSYGGEVQDEENDGFYSTAPKNPDQVAMSQLNKSFQTVTETIPAGITLTFKYMDKTFNSLIFKGSNGREYEIYAGHKIVREDQNIVANSGYLGLLFNTDIADNV